MLFDGRNDEKTNSAKIVLRFLMKNSFHKLAFTEIWSLFVGHNNYLNNDENFEVVHSFLFNI